MAYSATQLQLTHVLQRLWRRLNGRVTTATGGSTSTAVDTKLSDELEGENNDDIYNGGSLVVVKDAAGAAGAPECEVSRITDYVASTTTVTVSPVLTTAVASGDTILIAPPEFPYFDMIEVVNDALSMLGDVPLLDTSITTVANQTEYTLPLALKGRRLLNVELQGTLSDSNANLYTEVPNWQITNAAAGSTGILNLLQYTAGYLIRITYAGRHPRVSAFADYINEHFHPDLVHAAVFASAVQWRNDQNAITGGGDNALLGLEQKAWSQYDRAMMLYRPQIQPRRVRGMVHWGGSQTDEFYPIPLP